MTDDYICALSGLLPADNELVEDAHVDEELGDLPIWWTEVRVRRRVPNPEYLMILAVKDAMVQQELMRAPEEHRQEVEPTVRIQIDAMFAALEATIKPFDVDEVTAWVAPPHREVEAQGLTAAQQALWDTLDIDWLDEVEAEPEVEILTVPESMAAPEASVEADTPAEAVAETVEADAPVAADEPVEAVVEGSQEAAQAAQ